MCYRIPNDFLLPSDNLSKNSPPPVCKECLGAEYFVKPNGGLAVRIGMLPGVPWKIAPRFSRYQAPINRGDVLLLRNGQ